jgi:hypothetical protein
MSQELKPCPFCGHSTAPHITTAEELFRDEDDDDEWPHSESFAIICNASKPKGPGGCGASGGFFPSERLAIEAWNSRADAAPVGAPPGWQLVPVEPTPEMREAGAQYAECGISANSVFMWRAMLAAAPLAPVGAVLPADAIAQAVAAERDRVDRTMLELIDLWGTHGNAALIAGDAATSNQWALAVATLRDVSAALRADRVEAAQAEKREG